jgi:thiamine-monophosphate kinase
MNLSQLGELGLLQRIARRTPVPSRSFVPIGIGDDAAVVRIAAKHDLIVTTDMLVEGVDFDPAYGSFSQIGFKALAVNLSDIASMGGRPRAYLVGLAVPGRTPVTVVDELYRGMNSLARRHRMALIGGDLSASPKGVMITVMVLGEIGRGRAIARSGARVGEQIYVTGTLGDSRAGLELLQNRKSGTPTRKSTGEAYLIRRHSFPDPRTAFGQLLSRRRWASAMIDLSDGLATDLLHLCEASRVGARLALDLLPISAALNAHSHRRGRAAEDYALRGGEDFELLFTVPRGKSGAVLTAAKRMGLGVTRIGSIVPKHRGIMLLKKGGKEVPLTARGYEHFRSL